MPGRILIRYRGAGVAPAWLQEDERGRRLAGPLAGLPAPSALAASDVVVIVPGEDVSVLEAKVPARSREQLLRAVPFAVEDQLADPVESLHFAIGDGERGAPLTVLAVRRERLRGWLDELRHSGVQPDLVIPETLALPTHDERASVLLDGARAIVRAGPRRGFATEAAALDDLLAVGDLPRQDGVASIALVRVDGASRPALSARVVEEHAVGDAIEAFARGLRGQRTDTLPNLLQGVFAAQHRGAPVRRLWRFAAALAVTLLVLALAHAVLEWWLLERRVAELQSAQQVLYRSVYPDGRVLDNPAERMRADHLQRRGAGGGGPLPLLAQLAPLLTSSTQHTVESLEYRGGTLEVGMRAPTMAALDALRESAATLPGLRVELASASAGRAGAQGTLRVQERRP
jgi:general secretion pathway protein L